MVRMLLGIGNTLRRDDGVGNYIASRFRARGWLVLDCGTMPENFTGVVRRHHPELLVLVDAADIGLAPGVFRIVAPDRIGDVSTGTHNIPLTHLLGFLSESAGRIIFIGIQPGEVGDGEGITPVVRGGADQLIDLLKSNRIDDIERM